MADHDEQAIVLLLKMQPGSDPPQGSIGAVDGEMHPFVGWTGLASGIEAYCKRPEPGEPDRDPA